MKKNKLKLLTLFLILLSGNIFAQEPESIFKSAYPDLHGKYKIEVSSVYDVSQKEIYSELYKKLEDGLTEISNYQNNIISENSTSIFEVKELKKLDKAEKLPELKAIIYEEEIKISKYMFGKEIYGADSIKCVKHLSLFTEFIKQNNLSEAYNSWTILFNEFPIVSKNIYIKGNDILNFKIENAEKAGNSDEKEKWIDTLLLMYDQRIQFFDSDGKYGRGYLLGRKGIDLLKYRSNTQYEDAYKILMESVELQKEESELAVLFASMKATYACIAKNKIQCDIAVDNYIAFTQILEKQFESAKKSNNSTIISNIQKAIEGIDQFFMKTGCESCDKLEVVFSARYSESPDDVELMKNIINIFTNQKCDTSVLYEKVAEELFKIEPSESLAESLGTLKLRSEKSAEALTYFEKAIEFCSIDSIKATYYYKAGIIASSINETGKAILYAKEAINLNNNFGEPYILLGTAYSNLIETCGDAFEQSTVYWVIVDKLIIAKNKDITLSEKMNTLIDFYSDRYPDKDEAFRRGIYEGDLYTITCINETTIVRF
jgi:tetratricopeptide (TPR) repeat protein